jgi:hypothetical protein
LLLDLGRFSVYPHNYLALIMFLFLPTACFDPISGSSLGGIYA